MPILAIEGVPLPVLAEQLSRSFESVGSSERNQRGHLLVDRRRKKMAFDFTLAPKTLDEAQLYAALILGEGDYWSMQSSAYSHLGSLVTGTGAWSGAGGGNPYVTNGTWVATTGQTMTLKGSFYDQSAVGFGNVADFGAAAVGWRYDGTNFRVFGWSWRTLDTTATVKREALGTTGLGTLGTPQAYTGTETFGVSGKALVVTAGTGTFRYSGIRVFPWYLKAAQLDLLISGRNVQQYMPPLLPRVYVQSDLFPVDNVKGAPVGVNDSAMVMVGDVVSMPVQPTMQGGAFTQTTQSLVGKLTEV